MKLLSISKDGGPESNVTAFWLCEIKGLFSVALLRFTHGTRESFHSHAFNSVSWVLRGVLWEEFLQGPAVAHFSGLRPVRTLRNTFHRVFSFGTTWVLTFRGPWAKDWQEYDPNTHRFSRLTHGRKVTETWDKINHSINGVEQK
jgi:hypothetical protein